MQSPDTNEDASPPRDLLIVPTEVNDHHGVGILLQRLFGSGREFICLRSTTLYRGEEPFGAVRIELRSFNLRTSEVERRLREVLAPYHIRRILCVPYYREDFLHAALAKRITGAPLCTYVMDDQNVFAPHVPDVRVVRLLEASDLCLGISQEMCVAYQRKFGTPFHHLPPLLERAREVIPCYWEPEAGPLCCAMIGNIWTAPRFNHVRSLLRASGLRVDWYGNGPNAAWLDGAREEWEKDGLHCCGFLPEEDLIPAIASYPFVLIPSGTLGPDDDNPAFSRLSLPSRLLFLHATTDTPVLVLGSNRTAAGHFVETSGTGLCAGTDVDDLRRKIEMLIDPSIRTQLRRNIRTMDRFLTLPNGGEWIWASLAAGSPLPAAFSQAFPPPSPERIRDIVEGVRPASPAAVADRAEVSSPIHCAYSRNRNLRQAQTAGLLRAGAPDEIELTEFLQASTALQLSHLVQGPADVLLFGEKVPDSWPVHLPQIRFWRLGNFAEWCASPEEEHRIELLREGGGAEAPPPGFAAFVSPAGVDRLAQTPAASRRFSALCERSVLTGGWNLHVFTAVVHPNYRWVHPLYNYLRDQFLRDAAWPGWDDLLEDDDAYFMSPEVFERCWKPHVGKSSAEFGSPLWLGLAWHSSPQSTLSTENMPGTGESTSNSPEAGGLRDKLHVMVSSFLKTLAE